MIFNFFSAYGYSEAETGNNLFQFRSGFIKSSSPLPPIPREINSRSFPFVFLQHLAILDLINQQFIKAIDLDKTGILCGSVTSGIMQLALQYKRFHSKGFNKISPLTVPLTIHNSASSVLAIAHKIKGISSGYHCMETSGIEALCDGLKLIKAQEIDHILIGVGEDLSNKNDLLKQVGGIFLLTKNRPSGVFFNFEIDCLINRGKSWLSASENLFDLLNSYFEKDETDAKKRIKNEKWIYFNFQNQDKYDIKNYPVEMVEYPQFYPYLSMAPFLGISLGMQMFAEFKLLTISSEGHAVLLSFRKVEDLS